MTTSANGPGGANGGRDPGTGRGNEDLRLRRILDETRTIAMIGASADSERASHGVMRYMQQQGYRVIPINPTLPAGSRILGEPVYPDLRSIPETVDLVDVFRKPEAVAGIVEELLAVERPPGVLWLQLGVVDEDAAARARDAGIEVVMDRCLRIEHGRLAP